MTERFKKATDALCEAFFKGTLAKWHCMACACGTIVAKAAGVEVTKEIISPHSNTVGFKSIGRPQLDWTLRRFQGQYGLFVPLSDLDMDEQSKILVDITINNLTGYNRFEFAKIENAFEKYTNIKYMYYENYTEQAILEDQYNGLVAVYDVLMKLDEIADTTPKEKLKTHPKLVLA